MRNRIRKRQDDAQTDQHLPIDNPITSAAFPELITSRLQTIIRPQLIYGQRLSGQRVGLASLEMLVDGRSFVRVPIASHYWVVHGLEGDLSEIFSIPILSSREKRFNIPCPQGDRESLSACDSLGPQEQIPNAVLRPCFRSVSGSPGCVRMLRPGP